MSDSSEWTQGFTDAGAAQSEDKNNSIFIWKIGRFSTSFDNGYKLSSPVFSSDSCGRTQWKLEMYPNGVNKTCINNVSIFLRNVSNIGKMLSTHFTISLVDNLNNKCCSLTAKIALKESITLGDNTFISRPILFGKRNQFFLDGTLTVHCKIHDWISMKLDSIRKDKFTDTELDKSENSSAQCSQDRFSDDLMSILRSRKFCDVIFRTEGKEIGAHKAVMAARSTVFSSMFEHDMRENLNSCVEITDIAYETLEQFINYIYDGITGELNVESAMGLVSASDKYAIGELNLICSEFLKNNLSVDNCLEILVLADLHSDAELKEAAIEFNRLHFDVILANPDWKNKLKDRTHLAFELLVAISSKPKQ